MLGVVVEMRGGLIRSLDRALPKRGREGDESIISVSSWRPGEACTVMDVVVLLDPLLRIEGLRWMGAWGARLCSSGRLSSPEVSSGVKGAGGLKEPNAGPSVRTLPGEVLMAREDEKALRLTWWSKFSSLMSSSSLFRLCGDGWRKKFMAGF